MWVYGIDQAAYHEFGRDHDFVEFTQEFNPSIIPNGSLIVLDDLQTTITSGPLRKSVEEFVIRSVHHASCSIILILHNLFSPNFRTVALSTTYLILFSTPRDSSFVATLGRQCFGQYGSYLKDVYNYVTSKKARAYIFLDFSHLQSNLFRVRDSLSADDALFFVPVTF